uniref:Decapping nuclease n=1 Tax=Strongyloides stercoralis TaxID=6248 RepID=A0AAF5DCY9_STRER
MNQDIILNADGTIDWSERGIINNISVYLNLSDIINISKNYDQDYLGDLQETRSQSEMNVFASNEYNQIHLAVNSHCDILASIVNFDEVLENMNSAEEGISFYRKRLIRLCNITLSGLERIIGDCEVSKRSTYAAFFGVFYKDEFFINITFDNNSFDNQKIKREGLFQGGEVDIISLQLKTHFSFILNFKFTSNWENSNKGSNILRPFQSGILFNTTDCLIIFTFSNSHEFQNKSCCNKQNLVSKYRNYKKWLIPLDSLDFETKTLHDGCEISSVKIKRLTSSYTMENDENKSIICEEKIVHIKNLLIDLIDIIYQRKTKSGTFYNLDDFQVDLININEEKENITFYITALHRVLINNIELTYNVIKFHAIFNFNLMLIKSTLLSCVKISNSEAQESKFWYGKSGNFETYHKTPEAHIFDNTEQLNGESKKFLIPFYKNVILAM